MNDTNPLKAPKAARRKVTTDLGRQIMQRERQRLAREQAALGEQLAEEARRKMIQQKQSKSAIKPAEIAVSKGIVRRFAAVLQSEGVNVRIKANVSNEMSAWTDFEQIVLNYRMHEDVRLLAATMRGLAYHEGGHCRFTIPFNQLADELGLTRAEARPFQRAWNMLEDQRMETAVVSDSPRKAAYLTPVIMTELTDTVNAAADNYPLLVWRRYLPRKVRKGARKLFVLKHTQQGIDGEKLARAWETVVTRYVKADNVQDLWAAIVQAKALCDITNPIPAAENRSHERQTRTGAERDLSDALVIPIDPSMDEELGEMFDYDDTEVEIDVTDPAVAEHLADVFSAIMLSPETLVTIVYASPAPREEKPLQGGDPTPVPADEDDDEEDEEDDDSDVDEQEDDDDQPEDGDTEEGRHPHGSNDTSEEDEEEAVEDEQDESDEDDVEGLDDSSDHDDDDDSHDPEDHRAGNEEGDHTPEEDDDELTDDDLNEALEEAESERNADSALDGDVQAFNDAIDNRASDLQPYDTKVSEDHEAAAAAQNLATDLEESFYAATMDQAPTWVEQQRRGILNVIRYKTRQPGDVEVFKAWTDADEVGFNMAVSLMLDYSGSMSGYCGELAQAAYASKLACEKLGIPCTVTLWDTEAVVLWDANDTAESLPVIVANGGTNPTAALADLQNQRYDKTQHIVIIMTDGDWQDFKPGQLGSYAEQGRVIIGCGFGSMDGGAQYLSEKLRRYGCDENYGLSNLMDLPKLLEQTLVAMA